MAEARGQIAAAVVEAQAEIEVQTARMEQVKLQLEADVIEPARAQQAASINDARGQAAKIIEEGRATAAVLSQITKAWKLAGPNARDVFLMQKLQSLVDTMTKTVQAVKVNKVTVLGVGQNGAGLAPQVISASEQIKAALGVDVLGALQQRLTPAAAMAKPAQGSAQPPTFEVEVAPPPTAE